MHYIVSFEVCTALMLTTFTAFAAIGNPLKAPRNRAYLNLCVIIIVCCAADISASLLINAASDGADISVWLLYTSNIFYFIMQGMNGFFYYLYLNAVLGKNDKRGKIMVRIMFVPAAAFAIFASLTPITRALFYFDENNIYRFGSMHFTATAVTSFYIMTGITFFILKRKDISRLQFVSGIVFSLASGSGMLVQTYFLPNVCLGYTAAAVGAIMIYFVLQVPDPYVLMELLDELKKAKAEAEAASKAKENFLANMSHEMRTPVNSMLGMNEMIMRKSFDSEISSYARTAEKSGKALLSLINNILDYTQLNSGTVAVADRPYEVRPLVEEILTNAVTRTEGKNITVKVNAAPDIPCVLSGDRSRLKQVLLNLVSNAVKYTDEGSITVSVSSKPAGKSHVSLKISVADTGCGIRKENLDGIFRSFTKINGSENAGKSGAGLGLTISAMLLELMNGEISAESQYGKGSVFSVELVQGVENAAPMGEISMNSIREKKEREFFTAPDAEVLITDDNEINLFVLHEFLKQFGIKADTANNGTDCFALASEKAYDIIFLDHMMPQPDGLKIMRMIKETDGLASQGAAIVVTTANAVSGAREKYIEEGFDGYISKPVVFETVAETLINHLPAEKIIRYENGVPVPGAEDIFSEIRLSHINTSAGLTAQNENREEYFTALANYAETASDYADRLDRAVKYLDMNDYSKTAGEIADLSLRIGADNLADMANLQKMFAASGKTEDITAFHSNFMEILVTVTAEAAKICFANRPELMKNYYAAKK